VRVAGERGAVWRVGGDVALGAAAESLRSGVSSEVVTSVGVVLRKVRRLQLQLGLKTRRSVAFDFAETAGVPEFRRLTAGF